MASIGGFDEAVRDFLRVPREAHIESLARGYTSDEIAPIPLAAQTHGIRTRFDGGDGPRDGKKGAPRIDLNWRMPFKYCHGQRGRLQLIERTGLFA